MQSAVKHHQTLRLSMMALACHLACFSMAAVAQTTAPAEEKAVVTITGKKVGMGLMVQEDAPKARSTITQEELAKQRPTGNAFQALELMPAVNSYSHDSSGLFGGGLTMRGFNSDQIGATINGVPVNDSGSFSVFPQEYVDQENTCSEFVTQGSTDVDSPQVGATGGNFGINTCDPEAKQRVRVMQTIGQLRLHKTFVRYDTGLLSDGRSKAFVSLSHAGADKWKGEGGAARDHIDGGFNYDIDRFNFVHGTILYNKALNNNINNISLADLNSKGYFYDYSSTFIGHAKPTPGVADKDVSQNFGDSYYKLATNPFKNMIASATAKFRIGENTDIKFLPYYWYGFGTGSKQQNVLFENGFLDAKTGKVNATVDLNGDGDTKDSYIVANSSITKTKRPGMSLSITHAVGDHSILGGFWYERADHRQTGPAVAVDANGLSADLWLNSHFITRPDGTPYESRDWQTISTAYQAFLQDTATLMDNKLTLNAGVRTPFVKRDFTNFANEAFLSGSSVAGHTVYNGVVLPQVTYNVQKTYRDVLPQLGARYRITNDDQLFASLAKNFKAPPNFAYSPTNGNVQFDANGKVAIVGDVKAETSYNLDVGYRHQTSAISAQITAFMVDFRDRQATSFDPATNLSILINAGKVKNTGFEIELGNTPVNGWSFYSSLGYINSQLQDNLLVAGTVTPKGATVATPVLLPTAGKQMPLSPDWKFGLSASYETDSWYARLKAKYTGIQQATLINDEEVPAYTTVDLDTGYMFPATSMLKRTKLTFNISNLLNKQYRNPSSQTAGTALSYGGAKSSTVLYYLGAPRSASMTLSMDF